MSNNNSTFGSYSNTSEVSVTQAPEIDVLSDILQAIRLNASSYFCVEFSSPWGLDEPKTDCGTFHVVVRGSAWVKVASSSDAIYLSTGDIIAFPTGLAHQIGDGSGNNYIPGNNALEIIQQGSNPFTGGVEVSTLLCGYFQYQLQTMLPLLRDMPQVLHIKSENAPELNWLNYLVKTLANESQTRQPGGGVVIERLTEVLVIQLFRWYINSQNNTQGYFKALADNQLSRALSLLHKQPEKPWSVERLGKSVGMSRTAFARHFSDVVGMTPIAYLTQWRMHIANELLTHSKESMVSIAEKVGYSSEASFGKAFKKVTGMSPGQSRKRNK
ncbi:MAG: AraC family transcriptional regulator [Thalassotalea sp.]